MKRIKTRKYKLVRKAGGWCPSCDDHFDYICDDCGKCRWCCSC